MSPGVRRYAFVGTGHRAELYFAALLGDRTDGVGRAVTADRADGVGRAVTADRADGVGRAVTADRTDDGVPVALCDTNAGRMDYYQRLWRAGRPGAPGLATYDAAELDSMLARERPDVVVVTSIDRLHAAHVTAALAHGCDVVCEKPLTIDVDGCRAIAAAAETGPGALTVAFNYRYSPRNSAVKELVARGAVGTVTSVHFEWLLDTVHGADYFRRWHRDRANSGGLLVHKATHHFDLVNWWLDDVVDTVFAQGARQFYGPGTGVDPAPFAIDIGADARLRELYVDARRHDGYVRDRDPFAPGVTIEDNMAVLARYRRGALLTYSLHAYAPWEGYRVGINGTAGRLELTVVERSAVEAGAAERMVGWARGSFGDDDIDMAARAVTGGTDEVRPAGVELVVQRHWERAERVSLEQAIADHGGGDARLLADVFGAEVGPDRLGRRAGYLDGVRSVAVGIAANQSIASGQPVALADLGVPLGEAAAEP